MTLQDELRTDTPPAQERQATVTSDHATSLTPAPRWGQRWGAGAWLALLLIAVLASLARDGREFPAALRLPLGGWTERLFDWILDNLEWIYVPISDAMNQMFDTLQFGLMDSPAPTVALALIMIVYLRSGLASSLLTTIALAFIVSVSLWNDTLQTISLMAIAVSIAIGLGLLLGIVASRHRLLDRAVLTALDAIQTFPVFGYLVPVVFIFGPGNAAALVVTILWALPPITRMTIVGLAGVSEEALESATSTGTTARQRLFGVELPLAGPSIMAGINQTVMFAISMSIVASMIGASGLGGPVWGSLTRLEFGAALEAGIALVLLAIVFDKTTRPRHTSGGPRFFSDLSRLFSRAGRAEVSPREFLARHKFVLIPVAAFAALAVVVQLVRSLRLADFTRPPEWFELSLRTPVNAVVDWISLNLEFVLGPFISYTQRLIVGPVVDVLTWTPWPIVLVVTGFLGWAINGRRGAVFSVVAVLGIGALGMWDDTALTLATAGIAVVWALMIGLPIGALMSWSDRFEKQMTAALDIIQNIPIYLYVIPVVVVFGSGAVPGMLATVIYALPPVIRFTNVALRGVDAESVEAARSCGVTRWQLLYQVKIPLGLPTIMVAINQAIMLSLSMAVVSAFIGTPGLGRTLLVGVQTGRLDLAVEAGLSMFLLAIIVERLVSGMSNRITRRRTTESGAAALEEGATP